MKTKNLLWCLFWIIPLVLLSACGGGSGEVKGGDVSLTVNTGNNTADTEAPQCSIKINNDAGTTDSVSVSISLSATDNTGVTGYYISESSSTPLLSGTGWTLVDAAKSLSANASFTLSTGNGTKTVYAWFRDAAGNISNPASDSITFNSPDFIAPVNPSILINNDATSTSSTSVTLSLSATDNSGIAAYYVSEVATTPSADATGWAAITSKKSYSATVPFALSSGSVGDNPRTVYVWFMDAAGNISSPASDSITLTVADSAAPLNQTISINSGTASTTSTSVILSLSATDNIGVTAYYVSETATAPSANAAGWVSVPSATSYSADVSFTLSSGSIGNNTKTVYVWFRDAAGNVSTVTSDAITLIVADSIAPSSPSISINSGAVSTTSTAVTLTLSASDNVGITAYYLSETATTPSANATGWLSITSTKSFSSSTAFTLSSGSVGDNPRTVYVWFRDAAGNISLPASAGITLTVLEHEAPANPSISINSGAVSTTSTSVTLSLSATDNYGVTAYYVSEAAATPSANAAGWVSVTSTTSFSADVSFTISGGSIGNNPKAVYVWFRDAAGNISIPASAGITLIIVDSAAPSSPAISINSGASYTTSTSVTLALSATDNGGIIGYYLSETGATPLANAAGWVSVTSKTSYSATVPYTLSSSFGIKTLYVWFRDAAGNMSASASAGISLAVLEVEPNDGYDTANAMDADTDYIGDVTSGDDYFSITATGSSMTVSLNHVTQNAANSDFRVYIYYIAGSTRYNVGAFSATNGIGNSGTVGVVAGWTYYIKVTRYDSGSNSYQYKLRVTFGNVSNLEVEPNNSYVTANAIDADTDYIGESSYSQFGDDDYFSITATGSSMTVSLNHVIQNDAASDFTVYIYYYAGTTKYDVGNFSANNGIGNSKTIGVTSGRIYYINVHGSQDYHHYKLRVTFP